jgi:hypothetical protein
MTEQDMLALLTAAEKDLAEAKVNLTKARRAVTDAESKVIETKLNRDRAKEALRVFRNQQVIPGADYALFDDEDS